MKKQKEQPIQFAICLDSEGYKASLEVGKLYRVIPDQEAEAHGYLRVVDESGDDYAFAAKRFHLIILPLAVEQALLSLTRAYSIQEKEVCSPAFRRKLWPAKHSG